MCIILILLFYLQTFDSKIDQLQPSSNKNDHINIILNLYYNIRLKFN